MQLSDKDVEFLTHNHSAAMITVTPSGIAKAPRVAVALVDGKLWSSGTKDRARTKRLRRDPRSTLFIFDAGFSHLVLETTVRILEGPDVPTQTVRLMRLMQGRASGPLTWFGRELSEEEFVEQMVEEGRLIYEFEVHRAYGLH
jgi:hypothetical protein